jgi:phosphoacetylglucosamine mutase
MFLFLICLFLIKKELTKGSYKPNLTVDCANGVGAIAIQEFAKNIGSSLQLKLVNDGTTGILNHNVNYKNWQVLLVILNYNFFKCGADFVKVQQTFPENTAPVPGERFASLDGDADRIIYFYFDSSSKFHMLDGDKISLLFAEYLSELVKKAGLQIKLGVVQTAYANGSSTNYVIDKLVF